MSVNIDIFNTHIEVYPYKQFDQIWLEKIYTAHDKFKDVDYACGYIIDNGKLYVPRGTPVSKLEILTDSKANEVTESDPVVPMSRSHSSYFEPRDKLQMDSIDFLKSEGHQFGLNLLMGKGKTFCVAYASTELSLRTLIITPNDGIKMQWIKTYTEMFDYRPKDVINIAGSEVMDAILEGSCHEADVYIVNHQTLRSFLSSRGAYKFREFFAKLGAGIKVYDESHLEFANILLVDFFSNTERTWYLTATFDRSDKTEAVCFKQAFSTVDTFGEIESLETIDKHVMYNIVNINSHISPKNRARLCSYPGFSAAKYGKYCIFFDENDTAYKTILAILNKTTEMEGKTLIFLPLIEDVDEVVKRLKKDYPAKSVAAYHSKIDKADKEAAEKKDIIVSTIRSCGTGKDIKGLRSVICLEPIVSKLVTKQTIGRLRPYGEGKLTYFWDVVDRSIQQLNWWHRSRFKSIQPLVKEVIEINDILG